MRQGFEGCVGVWGGSQRLDRLAPLPDQPLRTLGGAWGGGFGCHRSRGTKRMPGLPLTWPGPWGRTGQQVHDPVTDCLSSFLQAQLGSPVTWAPAPFHLPGTFSQRRRVVSGRGEGLRVGEGVQTGEGLGERERFKERSTGTVAPLAHTQLLLPSLLLSPPRCAAGLGWEPRCPHRCSGFLPPWCPLHGGSDLSLYQFPSPAFCGQVAWALGLTADSCVAQGDWLPISGVGRLGGTQHRKATVKLGKGPAWDRPPQSSLCVSTSTRAGGRAAEKDPEVQSLPQLFQ